MDGAKLCSRMVVCLLPYRFALRPNGRRRLHLAIVGRAAARLRNGFAMARGGSEGAAGKTGQLIWAVNVRFRSVAVIR